MTGDIADDLSDGAGVIPRAIHQIFNHVEGERSRAVERAVQGASFASKGRCAEPRPALAAFAALPSALPDPNVLRRAPCTQALPASTASSAPTWSCTTRRSQTC